MRWLSVSSLDEGDFHHKLVPGTGTVLYRTGLIRKVVGMGQVLSEVTSSSDILTVSMIVMSLGYGLANEGSGKHSPNGIIWFHSLPF